MINAHCEQSPVVYCSEKKLYHFRIFEFKSEPFCEERSGDKLISRSCDNVTQKLRQVERNKRLSDSFPFHYMARAPNRRQNLCNRTKSLPLDLSDCGQDYFCREHTRDDHALQTYRHSNARENYLRRRINGFHRDSHDSGIHSGTMLRLLEDYKGESSEDDGHGSTDSLPRNGTLTTGRNIVDNAKADEQCARMKSKLNDLSTRYNANDLKDKTKDELISIVMELQDALKLAT